MATLSQYVHHVREAISSHLGDELSVLVSIMDDHSTNVRILEMYDQERAVKVFKPWDELVMNHLDICIHLKEREFIEAFNKQANVISILTKVLQALKEDNWPLAVLKVVCRDLRLLARAADEEMKRIKSRNKTTNSQIVIKQNEHLEKAAEALMTVFRVCATDIRPVAERSKRRGMITIINQLFKIYSVINKLHLCKPLIRALDNADMMPLFPVNEKVTYNYFLGIRSMFDGNYRKSESELTYAFTNCAARGSFGARGQNSSYVFEKNRRLILIYLIPVKMLLGIMPRPELLQRYQLEQFAPIVLAVKTGNLRDFDTSMASGSQFFWKFGIALILEKLRSILYRNIFKKVTLILDTQRIPIDAFRGILESLQDKPVAMDEVHCIIANLIFDGKIKGYISLQHQKLVVSKQNAFPPLNSVA